jgi:hypothetical protein
MGWELTERWLSGAGGMERQQPIAFYASRSVLVVILYFQKRITALLYVLADEISIVPMYRGGEWVTGTN